MLKGIQAIAIDLDGVVYLGDDVILGAADAISKLRTKVKWIYFVTNNSGKRRQTIKHKLISMNIPVEIKEIITSSYATAIFIKTLPKKISDSSIKAYVIGSEELKKELRDSGIHIVEENFPEKLDYLIVGYDPDFNYKKICIALNLLISGAKFIACNRDRMFPTKDGIMPGCGSMVASIENAWGKKPDFEIGKPNTFILKMITKETNLRPNQILVVGDSLESDIAMAKNYGSPSVLVSKNMNVTDNNLDCNLMIGSLTDLCEDNLLFI